MQKTVRISNNLGIHARPAALITKTAFQFEADVRITSADSIKVNDVDVPGELISVSKNEGTLDMMGLLTMELKAGKVVTIDCEGPDAEQALDALIGLIENKFYEQ